MAKQLVEQGDAYYCHCSSERLDELRGAQKKKGQKTRYDNHCRNLGLPYVEGSVVRLKSPLTGQVGFSDKVYGAMEVDNTELDDLVMCRSDGMPTYNLAVVVDDIDCKISHVIRGDDHINNTFRQLHIYQALGVAPPTFAHTPMVLGDDGSKLSKRHGALSVLEYRKKGYLPQALVNYLLRLGWSSGDQELFSVAEMIEKFAFKGMNKAAPRFDLKKLIWINQQYLQQSSFSELSVELHWHLQQHHIEIDEQTLGQLFELYQERIETLAQFITQIKFVSVEKVEISEQDWQQHIQPSQAYMESFYNCLVSLENWQPANIMACVKEFAQTNQLKMFQVGMPFRLALSGTSQSPDFSKIAAILGKQVSLKRLKDTLAQSN